MAREGYRLRTRHGAYVLHPGISADEVSPHDWFCGRGASAWHSRAACQSRLHQSGHPQIGEPAAEAALEAGLKPRTLLKHEYAKFGARTAAYLEARNSILQQWAAEKTKFLTLEACIGKSCLPRPFRYVPV